MMHDTILTAQPPSPVISHAEKQAQGGFTKGNQIRYGGLKVPVHVSFGKAMTPLAARKIARVAEPDPFGDVTIAPAAMTGQSETQLARAMAHALGDSTPTTASQALSQLRALFPEVPLTVRVAALNSLMRR